MTAALLTYADQVHEAVHAVADLEEDVAALPDGLRAESRPQQPGDAGHQEERAQEHGDDLHLLHQGDGDGLPLHTESGQKAGNIFSSGEQTVCRGQITNKRKRESGGQNKPVRNRIVDAERMIVKLHRD